MIPQHLVEDEENNLKEKAKKTKSLFRCILLGLFIAFLIFTINGIFDVRIRRGNINSLIRVKHVNTTSIGQQEQYNPLPDNKNILIYSESDVDSQRLLYNRVPKCGSTTLIYLMQRLSKRNGYSYTHSNVYDKRRVNIEEQRKIVKTIKNSPTPCIFDRHLYFVNFTSFGELPPVYINNIRDPVEKIISGFYYHRLTAKRTRTNYSSNWYKKDFEKCVKANDPECISDTERNLQIPFFCGQEHDCRIAGIRDSLQKAKQNIEKHFAVVGVLEYIDLTMQVLEVVLPQFFKGAYKMYLKRGLRANKNPDKKDVPENVKSILRQKLGTEYELYDFVVQRLQRQYNTVLGKRQQHCKKIAIF